MKNIFPKNTTSLLQWSWTEIEPFYNELSSVELNPANVNAWLKDWSDLISHVDELYTRLYIATTQYTADNRTEQNYNHFIDTIQSNAKTADQLLKQKLLESNLEPDDFELPLRKMRTEAGLFRSENLPLIIEEQRLATAYNKIIGGMAFLWEGKERTNSEMSPLLLEEDRTVREKAWKVIVEGRLKHRQALNELWSKLMGVRQQIAANNNLASYREYVWQQKFRFDYSPSDCKTFHQAIEEVVVPAVERIYQRRKERLGIRDMRPWDINVDTLGQEPLKPYQTAEELIEKTNTILTKIDPEFGNYFGTMRTNNLLDVESRKNKAPGAYSLGYAAVRQPFIFMSAAGTHDDVETLMHESGHAVHEFERAKLEYFQHRSENYLPAEFAEVASMGMELLVMPYLQKSEGGFYEESEAARANIKHLEDTISFWPYMALVDTFQHWVYENPDQSVDGVTCENKWAELWDRFMPSVDYSGLEDAKKTYWHRQLHIFTLPFYYIEYGMAQLGAVQVWANSLNDPQTAIANYKKALALGSTVSLPDLFHSAGASFSFDVTTLKKYIDLMEKSISDWEAKL